jgi:two-component system sensor histidine kinase RegB
MRTMSYSLSRALLSPAAPPTSETADRWLIGLRWIAILGMVATSLVARRLVPDLEIEPLLTILAALAALNLGWRLAAARRPGDAPLVAVQVIVDVATLTLILWFAGGTSNPFAVFLAFHIVLAGLLCGARMCVAVALMTLVAVTVLSFAEPLPLAGAPLGAAEVRRIGNIVSLAALAAFIGFFVMVTVHRLEQLRAESARNEKLAVLGRLVGAMSHELNTPLNTILLASKDLVEVGREVGSPEVSRLAQTVADEAERASELVGLVRGHVRPDLHPQPLDLAALVRDFAERELTRLGFGGERRIEVPGALPAVVLRAGVCQVLSNVLTNAVQATAGQDAPRIAVRLRAIAWRGRAEISVEDSGPGLSRALLARAGEPFQTTKAESGGMGLGLYVSTLLAERMGGSLSIDNHTGGGARVTLSLRTDAS